MNEDQTIGMLEQERLDVRESTCGQIIDDIDPVTELQKMTYQM